MVELVAPEEAAVSSQSSQEPSSTLQPVQGAGQPALAGAEAEDPLFAAIAELIAHVQSMGSSDEAASDDEAEGQVQRLQATLATAVQEREAVLRRGSAAEEVEDVHTELQRAERALEAAESRVSNADPEALSLAAELAARVAGDN